MILLYLLYNAALCEITFIFMYAYKRNLKIFNGLFLLDIGATK